MPTMTDRLSRLRRLVLRVSAALRWLPPTVARLTIGFVFLQSGWGKLHDIPKVVGFFTQLGIPAPEFQARLVAGTEFVCGSLMLLGLATRLATIPLIATMVVALLTALKSDIHGFSDVFGASEYLYIALLLWLGVYGAGPISLDAVFAKRFEAADRPLSARAPAAR
jgi:putative oxidoreductase